MDDATAKPLSLFVARITTPFQNSKTSQPISCSITHSLIHLDIAFFEEYAYVVSMSSRQVHVASSTPAQYLLVIHHRYTRHAVALLNAR
jgi:hypothetical protein